MKRISMLAILLLLGGCGYTLQGSGSILPTDVKIVTIPLAQNSTTQPNLGVVMTEALRDRFERFGVVNVTDERGGSDAILEARVVKLVRKASSLTSNTASALNFDLTLTVSATLKRANGQVLWRNDAVAATRTFGATGGVVVTSSADFAGGAIGTGALSSLDSLQVQRGQEQETLTLLADDIAKKIYDDAVAPDF